MAADDLVRVDGEVKRELEKLKEEIESEVGIRDPSYNDVLRIKLFGKDYEESREEFKVFNL